MLENHGQISVTAGVMVESYDHGHVHNAGLISGQTSHGIYVILGSLDVEIRNSGTVSGANGITVSVSTVERLVNTGEILGGDADGRGVDLGAASSGAVIVNRGLIAGELRSIAGSSHDDTIRNAGLLEGDVELSGGHDVYRGKRGGWVDGEVRGGVGNDLLVGSSADDVLSGDNGHDVLRGRGGDDVLIGGNGRDVFDIQLGNGNDVIMDFASNDLVDLSDFGLGWKRIKNSLAHDGYEGLMIDLSEHGGGSILFAELTLDGFSRSDFIL